MNASTGTLIAYATSPGKTASDGNGRNGLYTQELLKWMKKPGLKVEDVFKNVRKSVLELSNQAQLPWDASSLVGEFSFSGDIATASSTDTATNNNPPAGNNTSAVNYELEAWNYVKNGNNPDDVRQFLKDYPGGKFSSFAKNKLRDLDTTYWETIKNSNSIDSFNLYLKKYPDGQYVETANSKIITLSQPITSNSISVPVLTSPSSSSVPNEVRTPLVSKPNLSGGKKGDVNIMNSLLALEHQAVAAYQASGETKLCSEPVLKILVKYQDHHKQHRDALAAIIKKFGGKPYDAATKYDIANLASSLGVKEISSEKNIVDLLNKVDEQLASAYYSVSTNIDSKDILKAIVSIMAAESNHVAIYRAALGNTNYASLSDLKDVWGFLPSSTSSAKKQDVAIMNVALGLEYQTVAVYQNCIATKLLSDSVLKVFAKFLDLHKESCDSLIYSIKKAGSTFVEPQRKYDILGLANSLGISKISSEADCIRLVKALENLSTKAYLGALPALESNSAIKLCSSILSVHAKHCAIWLSALGEDPSPQAFVG